jgi:hypothetical protein
MRVDNRYRVIGPFFGERLGLIPGPTDLGVSVRSPVRERKSTPASQRRGYGRAEADKFRTSTAA